VSTDALKDQIIAAQRDHRRMMRQGPKGGITTVGAASPFIGAFVNTLLDEVERGTATPCRHLSGPQPVFAALWAPGRLSCALCITDIGRITPEADRTCDKCGRRCAAGDDPFHPFSAAGFGDLLTVMGGFCDACYRQEFAALAATDDPAAAADLAAFTELGDAEAAEDAALAAAFPVTPPEPSDAAVAVAELVTGLTAEGATEVSLSDRKFTTFQSAAAQRTYTDWTAGAVHTCRHRPAPGDAAVVMLSDTRRVVCMACAGEVSGRPGTNTCDRCARPFDHWLLKGREVFKTYYPAGALLIIGTVCAECSPQLGDQQNGTD
jgi:hypothetical protein